MQDTVNAAARINAAQQAQLNQLQVENQQLRQQGQAALTHMSQHISAEKAKSERLQSHVKSLRVDCKKQRELSHALTQGTMPPIPPPYRQMRTIPECGRDALATTSDVSTLLGAGSPLAALPATVFHPPHAPMHGEQGGPIHSGDPFLSTAWRKDGTNMQAEARNDTFVHIMPRLKLDEVQQYVMTTPDPIDSPMLSAHSHQSATRSESFLRVPPSARSANSLSVARHIEQNMDYAELANRIAGSSDLAERVAQAIAGIIQPPTAAVSTSQGAGKPGDNFAPPILPLVERHLFRP